MWKDLKVMKYYSIGEFSKLTDLLIQTQRRWDGIGKLNSIIRLIYSVYNICNYIYF